MLGMEISKNHLDPQNGEEKNHTLNWWILGVQGRKALFGYYSDLMLKHGCNI